jgi:hypothetical protein
MIIARMSHGGVVLRDSSTGRLIRWLMMSSGTPTDVRVDGDEVTVRFADGKHSIYDLNTGALERQAGIEPIE